VPLTEVKLQSGVGKLTPCGRIGNPRGELIEGVLESDVGLVAHEGQSLPQTSRSGPTFSRSD